MISTPWSAFVRFLSTPAHSVRSAVLLTMMFALAACSDGGIVEPGRAATPFSGNRINADVVVTPSYSAYDARAQFNGAGLIAHHNDFEEFTGDLVYVQPTPWKSNGVTYTSALNIVLGPGVGLGVQSNAISTEFGDPVSAQLGASDAFTMLGVDVTLIGSKVPVSLVVTTNLASYSFDNLDIPLATTGSRFLGLALSQSG